MLIRSAAVGGVGLGINSPERAFNNAVNRKSKVVANIAR